MKLTPVFLLLSFLFFTGKIMLAQESTKHNALKIYGNIYASSRYYVQHSSTQINKQLKFIKFSPAITTYLANGNFRELELTKFAFNIENQYKILNPPNSQVTQGALTSDFSLALRYEYNIMIFKKKKSKLKFYGGVSTNPYFSGGRINPYLTRKFNQKHFTIGSGIAVIPRVIYAINESLFLDINSLISIIDLQINSTKIENPTISKRNQNTTKLKATILPYQLLLRVGFGVKF